MKSRFLVVLCVCFMAFTIVGCATDQEGQQVRRGAGAGALAGGALGLTLGVISGEPGFAAAGAAAGAAVGGASGAMYMYDQSRDDRRTKMLADSIGGAKKGETVDDAGKRHLEDFLGDWDLDIWALDAEGKKTTARGKAKGVLESKETARIEYKDIVAPGYDQEITGVSVLSYSPSKGFSLENKFSVTPGVRTYVGEYIPDKNAYNFYPSTNKEGQTITGVIRSNVRIELRVSGSNLMVAETYTMIDGKEVKMQSYRFTKP